MLLCLFLDVLLSMRYCYIIRSLDDCLLDITSGAEQEEEKPQDWILPIIREALSRIMRVPLFLHNWDAPWVVTTTTPLSILPISPIYCRPTPEVKLPLFLCPESSIIKLKPLLILVWLHWFITCKRRSLSCASDQGAEVKKWCKRWYVTQASVLSYLRSVFSLTFSQ